MIHRQWCPVTKRRETCVACINEYCKDMVHLNQHNLAKEEEDDN